MNQYFSFNRFFNLYKLWWFRNHKTALLYLGVLCGLSILIITWVVWVTTDSFNHFEGFRRDEYMPLQVLAFVALGIFYSGASFPGFRSKEKTFEYLLLPSTILEKFLFEWINRVLIFVVIFPPLLSLLTNLTTNGLALVHPEFTNTKVELIWALDELSGKHIALIVIMAITLLNIPFMGASHFQAKPILKTLFFFFVCLAVYFLYIYGMVQLFDLENRSTESECVWFICSQQEATNWVIGAGIFANIILMTISYLKLKEKEV